MRRRPKRLFINIAPVFPHSKGWVATYRNKNNVVKGVLYYRDKISLMLDLDNAIPDDDGNVEMEFEHN